MEKFQDTTLAPCGPECRAATPLEGEFADWVWCSRRGAPRFANPGSDCAQFTARTSIDVFKNSHALEQVAGVPTDATTGEEAVGTRETR